MEKELRTAFFEVEFYNAVVNKPVGTITLPDEDEVYRVYRVVPRESINTCGGLTGFDLVRDDGVETYTSKKVLPDGDWYHTGIIHVGRNHISAMWDEDTEDDVFRVEVHAEYFEKGWEHRTGDR